MMKRWWKDDGNIMERWWTRKVYILRVLKRLSTSNKNADGKDDEKDDGKMMVFFCGFSLYFLDSGLFDVLKCFLKKKLILYF